jgi:dipeptide/tripeptide permease
MSSEFSAPLELVLPLVLGMLLIGIGGSVVKPCISGTVQKTGGAGVVKAFAIFYMVINIGSLFGRAVGFVVRRSFDLSFIFAVAAACALLAFLVVLFLFKEPAAAPGAPVRPRRSPWQILKDMVLVLRDLRFALFLLVLSGFFFLYGQIYNVLPLYLKKVVETDPAMDLYTMANPLVIVLFQLLVTRWFGGLRPVRSMVVGTLIISGSMALNIVPLFLPGGPTSAIWGLLPVASLAAIGAVAMVALGELFTSARSYEYIGALAPKGREGLFLGYASLPMAVGALAGGPVGAAIFNEVMCAGATQGEHGLLVLDPVANASGWLILSGVGLLSAGALWAYDRFLKS